MGVRPPVLAPVHLKILPGGGIEASAKGERVIGKGLYETLCVLSGMVNKKSPEKCQMPCYSDDCWNVVVDEP